jgi:hypothetical protein
MHALQPNIHAPSRAFLIGIITLKSPQLIAGFLIKLG